ncbi:hypothetical protein [Croceicoccus sediminis]|uniref:hypothetical protein n=1 Tax=Croceicoccus sediminis TaxID=2571150 RepID=UPI001182352A|nr:hypothetical protein [Croceicoccus sediminis]
MSVKNKILFALAAVLVSAPALAEPRQIQVGQEAYTHAATGFVAPPDLLDYARIRVVDFGANEINLLVRYWSEATKTDVSVYIYSMGVADASIETDRAMQAILAHDRYSGVDEDHRLITRFGTEAIGPESGFRISLPTPESRSTATGVAVFTADEWVIKTRMTSEKLSAEELDQVLAKFVAEISVNDPKRRAPMAQLIETCQVDADRKPAKRSKSDATQWLMVTTLWKTYLDATDEDEGPAKREWCRDTNISPPLFGYKNKLSDETVIVFGDSGFTGQALRIKTAELLGGGRKFWPMLSNGQITYFFDPFRSLPDPGQLASAVKSEKPKASYARDPEGNSNVSIPGS